MFHTGIVSEIPFIIASRNRPLARRQFTGTVTLALDNAVRMSLRELKKSRENVQSSLLRNKKGWHDIACSVIEMLTSETYCVAHALKRYNIG